ncbi:glycosyltransferase [Candidatus Shapirobacteria bacterium]|nr:glycosyltransferase [Candidatus Shapirobacteria bacterium]
MVSVIITAYQEKETVSKAIESFLLQLTHQDELLVVAPDKDTLLVAQAVSAQVKTIADQGKGKPAALNLALSKAQGELVILTDGDVWTHEASFKNLLQKLKNPKTGLVSGRPVSLNDRGNIFGFWAYILTKVAHKIRLDKENRGEYLDASGYLLAARKHLLPALPEKVLADDVYFSQKVYSLGYRIGYAPKAEVYVKYPANFRDWLKQKVRSTGGAGEKMAEESPVMRSFFKEASGLRYFLSFPENPKEWFWLLLLLLARVYVWLLIVVKIKLFRKRFWPRVESTK